ncbi:type VI secretion protein [Thioclava sp. SK-1]|uniref:type VI secretion system baseplate subunit TssF n=1 Tax=Thioclava sp. SK-1 TaxID=1889770 RepID=UPI0008268C98|nr:type VI secretion system baseplate subunit TssF [Thioclava sp. SK-1]OCX66470.1 type VI secretion protein [Thioclava sp. SK-1]
MKRAFRDSYNQELAILRERASEFALEYPGLADRLGGLLEENLDPTVAGLLEGSAFLAARVQLKMHEEFRSFTHEMLDQVFPDALAPTPSAMMVRASIPVENSDIVQGLHFAPGQYLDARFVDADKRVSCRFALAAPLTLYPLALTGARYHAGTGPIGALGQEIAPGTKAGLVFDIARLGPSGTVDGAPLSEVALDRLQVHLTGPMTQAAQLYEQLFANVARVSLRWLNANGDPVFSRLPVGSIESIGFASDERLFPHNSRLFDGFALLREYFAFPRKFMGFIVTGLKDRLRMITGTQVQVIIEFDQASLSLEHLLEPGHLSLHCVPAVNLFEEISSQVRVDQKHHELLVMPNSAPATNYEYHAITDVWAYYPGHQQKMRVHPLYALPPDDKDPRQVLYFTSRRKPRRLTVQEKRFGSSKHRYKGTETFLSLYEPPGEDKVQRLQVRGLCSNRHLTEHLPIAQGGDDFYLVDDQSVVLACAAGPSAPRASLADLETSSGIRAQSGDVYWRLLSYLSLNHFGLESRDRDSSAAPMRELLALFADLSDNVAQAHVAGLRDLKTRPVTRTMAHPDGYHTARGLEITLTFDEEEYEGAGVMVLGAVLDRFLAEYAAVNSFTQIVIQSHQRQHIVTFPPRTGSGPLL